MARMTRVSVLTLLAASCLTVYGCSGSNDSPTTGGGAGAPYVAGAPNVAGSPGGAGAPAGAGSPGASGSPGAAGANTGGAPAAAGAAGASTAGAPGTGGTFTPLCVGLKTAAMAEPAKAIACADPSDPQLCYRTCGPQSSGYKSETCTGGAYAEQSGCTFPPELDATCFKLPATQDASCPTAVAPKASDPCTIAACTVCNLGGGATGTYLDSKGMQKVGYCVCQLPTGGATTGKWSCGSTDAWPCPGAMGC
jgi:hypothetical protein